MKLLLAFLAVTCNAIIVNGFCKRKIDKTSTPRVTTPASASTAVQVALMTKRPNGEYDCIPVDPTTAENKLGSRLNRFMPEIETAVRLRSFPNDMVVKYKAIVAGKQCHYTEPFTTGFNVTVFLIHSHCRLKDEHCDPFEGPQDWDQTSCYPIFFSENYYFNVNECYDQLLSKGN